MRAMLLKPADRARMLTWTALLIVGVAIAGLGGGAFDAVGAHGNTRGNPSEW